MSRIKCKYVQPDSLNGELRWIDPQTYMGYRSETGSITCAYVAYQPLPTKAGGPRRWGLDDLVLEEVVELQYATPPAVVAAPTDLKFDGGKDKWSLLRTGCTRALQGVIRVLTFGAKKYEAHSWQKVENGVERYRDALDRHLAEIDLHGMASVDAESGELHIHHVACNALFLAELQSKVKV